MKKCITCGANADSDYCFRHKPRKPLAKMSSLLHKKLDKKQENSGKNFEFFLSLWKKLPHYSMVSGKYLGKEPLSVFFHHILPKEKYPQAAFDEENIVLLTLEEHNQVEMDIYRFEEVNNKRNYLKHKYSL